MSKSNKMLVLKPDDFIVSKRGSKIVSLLSICTKTSKIKFNDNVRKLISASVIDEIYVRFMFNDNGMYVGISTTKTSETFTMKRYTVAKQYNAYYFANSVLASHIFEKCKFTKADGKTMSCTIGTRQLQDSELDQEVLKNRPTGEKIFPVLMSWRIKI